MTCHNRRLLLVAYFFPPAGGAGSQRPMKFAKYLSQLGWDVVVVTRTAGEGLSRFEPKDEGLTEELESFAHRISVVRVATKGGGGSYAAWSESAARVCSELLDNSAFDAVLITMSPFELSRIAREISQRFSVPVVLDLRDPWALDGWRRRRTIFHWWIDYRRMKRALERADSVIANTPEAAREFRRRFPAIRDLIHLTNGYDEADFAEHRMLKFVYEANRLNLLFTGSLMTKTLLESKTLRGALKRVASYSPEKIDFSGRTLIHLLKALRILRGRRMKVQISITCIGAFTEADRISVAEAGASDCVSFLPYEDHDSVVRRMCQADALFLPLHSTTDGRPSLIVPGKAYEYMATGRPILACLPPGDARDIIENCGTAQIADPTDAQSIADALERLIADRSSVANGDRFNSEWVQQFERRQIAIRLSDHLKRLPPASPRQGASSSHS